MKPRKNFDSGSRIRWMEEASLTVEAALVLPIFLYFVLAFLYFIQIFTVQEQIQAAITKMGLKLSKAAYVVQEFSGPSEAMAFDVSVFGLEIDLGITDWIEGASSQGILKSYSKKYLNTDYINRSCIKGGFRGISFEGSNLFADGDMIDIHVSYQVEIPARIFLIPAMNMEQRVRLRSWTGYQVAAAYQREDGAGKEDTVFVAQTGSVYHKSENCSHIKLSIRAVQGIPTGLRNEHGAKYHPCEVCCKGGTDQLGTYYITSDGTRYHITRECSAIKRNVREIPLSEVGTRTPCKRCYQ
ncbi:MAG TPA: pilus assembly protein [Clostridiales bacterium]|nr:pilus assembly protein [Clostridiales bacterium]